MLRENKEWLYVILALLMLIPGIYYFTSQSGYKTVINTNELSARVGSEMARLHLPGLAAAKIDNGKIIWKGYYGYQDLEKRVPVNRKTTFALASISKTVTAAAIMQLNAKGKFQLDDDINRYLPFSITNPNYPNTPITFRQLLRHRSSISDNFGYLAPFWENTFTGPDVPLREFLEGYLTEKGTHFIGDKNFIRRKPGSAFEYSNVGYALLGYLVENISKMPFDGYCNQFLFEPIGMRSASWFLSAPDSSKAAVPYIYSDSLQQYQRQKHSIFPDYPAGQLRSNVEDIAGFLACWANDGTFNGQQIIDSTAVQTLTPVDMSLGFHTWFMYLFNTETILYSHSGHGPGTSTYMLYDPFTKKGLVILTNGDLSSYNDWRNLISIFYNFQPD
jgi:CubicO group peptidase (beta-lactamase class C family)